ncbi:MAG: (Na+)-NQR maturation NqrM [Acidobacteria bacterium]|nr:(Na+)-NQR maturation NqrM [Acidobacteriota bacterium]
MPLLVLVLIAFGLAMIGMAVGVILSNRALRGSCGGVAVAGPDGEPLTCGNCNCKLPEEADSQAA